MEDPRCNLRNQVDYPLEEILFLVISAVVSGIDTWKGVALFGDNKLNWLREYFPYVNGTPVASTLSRLFIQLDNEQFTTCFIDWVTRLGELRKGDLVAIDGKRMRGSYDVSEDKAAIHMVSAFASQQGLCLGQIATQEKSNEITAIPELLELLTLKDCVITIDAMGCQRDISKQILKKEADYILQVKNNQKGLLEQIEKVFEITKPSSSNKSHDLGHGRSEIRTCQVVEDFTFFDDYKDWPGICSLVKIHAERTDKQTGKLESSNRYYISSRTDSAENFNQNIRSHWAIENKLHWVLDVTFNEDRSRKRKGKSAENFGIFTKIAINMLNKVQDKLSKPSKRIQAMLSDQYREKLLGI